MLTRKISKPPCVIAPNNYNYNSTAAKHCREILTCSQELKQSVICSIARMNTTEIAFLRACPTMGRRLTEWLRLESISGEHLSHTFCSSVVRNSRLLRITSNWVLRMYTDGDLSAFWENLFQCSSTVMENVFFFLCLIRISMFQFAATGHLWGEFISFFFIPPISYFYTFIMFPWTLFSPGWIVPALHSYVRYSSPSIFQLWFAGFVLLSWTLISCLPCTGGLRIGHSTPHVSHKCWAEVKDHLLQSAGNTLLSGCHSSIFTLFGRLYCCLCCKAVPIAEVFSID